MDFKSVELRLIKIENLLSFQKKALTLNEAIEYTGIKKSYMYKLTSTHKIPYYKPNGKSIYFDRLELEKWLLSNRIKTNAEVETEALTYIIKH